MGRAQRFVEALKVAFVPAVFPIEGAFLFSEALLSAGLLSD
jgi:hypothetical protein